MDIALLTHVSLAILSLALAAYGLVNPSFRKIRSSAAMTVLTLISGLYLAISRPGQLGRVCLSATLFLMVMLVAMWVSARRIKKQPAALAGAHQ